MEEPTADDGGAEAVADDNGWAPRSVPISDRDAVLGEDDVSGDSGGDGVARPQMGSGVSAEGSGQDEDVDDSPTGRLVALLGGAEGLDLPQINRALAEAIRASAPHDPGDVFAATARTIEDSVLFLADVVVSALAQMDALPLGYSQTMVNVAIGLEHIRLRALYDQTHRIEGEA